MIHIPSRFEYKKHVSQLFWGSVHTPSSWLHSFAVGRKLTDFGGFDGGRGYQRGFDGRGYDGGRGFFKSGFDGGRDFFNRGYEGGRGFGGNWWGTIPGPATHITDWKFLHKVDEQVIGSGGEL